MTPDQFIQAIEPWIEIANTVITLYWAVVLLPALGCAAAVYAVIATERWIDGIDGRYLPGSGYQPRGKDTGVRIPPRGGSASVRPEDRLYERALKIEDNLTRMVRKLDDEPRLSPGTTTPCTIRG